MRVLIIDDDTQVRTMVRLLLENAGYEVAEIGDGREAVKTLRQTMADVILCDMFMPDCDGLQVIRDLCREFPGVKIICMSGGGFNGTMDILPVAGYLGASGILYKPFSQTAAQAAIERVLGTKSSTPMLAQ